MSKLKTFPVDLLGTAPSNKVSGEVRIIEKNEDRIFIPTGGPFYTKSLKVWAGATLLQVGKDYVAKELNRNATIDSGKEVCNAIQILNKGSHFLLEYQVIGGDYSELGEELADFIKGTPLNDLTKTHWNNILYKPTVFPPSPHTHAAPEWRGYGEAIYLVDQMYANLSTNRNSVFTAIKEEIRLRVEEVVQQYIDKNGVVITDKAPTPKGNVFLIGNGKQPNPLHFDIEALYRELDDRYFRNIINPLTRIGAISDSFLPITSGFFNVANPLISARWTRAVAKIERNGDLFVLTPASDGERIRYVYGYVREWTRLRDLTKFKPTNQQYRPPGLAANEEIMDLMGITNQTMIAAIYTINDAGSATFKEHAIVELNDSLYQDNHVLIRIGQEILNNIGSTNPDSTWSYRPSFARIRDGSYYLVSLFSGSLQGSMQLFKLSSDLKLSRITSMNFFKETRVVEHVAGAKDKVLSTNSVPTPNYRDGYIMPFHWFASNAKEGEYWIIDNVTKPLTGYSFGTSIYNNDLIVHVEGDGIYCNLSFSNRASMSGPTGWLQNNDASGGASYRIEPKKLIPEIHWLRTKSATEEESSYLVNAEQGYYRQRTDNISLFHYHVPYDMTGGIQDISAYHRSSQIHLADGNILLWRPHGLTGGVSYLFYQGLGDFDYTPTEMMNGYNINRQWRINSSRNRAIGSATMTLENPTIIPLDVGAIPMNDGLVLLQQGSGFYGGGPVTCNHYVYKPSKKIIPYKTLDLGTVSGYETSDDRKLIGNIQPTLYVTSRDHLGNCRYSAMSFHRPLGEFVDQVAYRKVYLTYDNPAIVKEQPYHLKRVGFDQIEFAINSIMGGDRNEAFTSWGLIISPEDPTVAFFNCLAAHGTGQYRNKSIYCAAKLTWNQNNELVGFAIRPEPGQVQDFNLNVTAAHNPVGKFWYHDWAIQYNANKSESHWHGRHTIGFSYPGNSNSTSSISSYKMTKAADGFPVITRYFHSGHIDGRSMVVATPAGIGVSWDSLTFGIYRVFRPFLNFEYVSGNPWSSDNSKAFVWYNPRPTVSYKLRVTEDISIQLGGVFSKILAGVYELTDPNYSTVIDPKNKTILIYATLQRGKAILEFSEFPLPESIYTVYLGKCITDEYGVKEADILPASRIGNYRASATPQGSAFSVSSGTANQELLLNWDAGNFTPLNPNREVGVDMSQFTGNVTFDEEASYVKVLQDGRFFVKDKAAAVEEFNGFIAVKTSGGVNGARGYLNGREIWKGKGTSWNRWNATPYIVEGWNVVHMEWGDLWIEARLFKSKP